jgi:probable addiction module antidote protein
MTEVIMTADLIPFDPSAFLGTAEARAEYLTAALETGDASFISDAIGTIAKARGMAALADETGLNRQQLYKALSGEGNPTLSTLVKVLSALELKLTSAPA